MDTKNTAAEKDAAKKKKRLILIGILMFVASAILVTSLLISYFSDMISKSGTISSGTLDITGDYLFYVNGSATPVVAVNNMNPGDVVVVKATVTNIGNKSAWVRDVITFDTIDPLLLPYLEVYSGEHTAEDLAAGGAGLADLLIPLTEGASAVTATRVIDGTGTGAETEGGGGFTYIGSNTYDSAISIYFSHTAGNDAQDKTLTFTAMTQALQFRNNNAALPDDTAWATVIDAPFGE